MYSKGLSFDVWRTARIAIWRIRSWHWVTALPVLVWPLPALSLRPADPLAPHRHRRLPAAQPAHCWSSSLRTSRFPGRTAATLHLPSVLYGGSVSQRPLWWEQSSLSLALYSSTPASAPAGTSPEPKPRPASTPALMTTVRSLGILACVVWDYFDRLRVFTDSGSASSDDHFDIEASVVNPSRASRLNSEIETV